MTILLFSIFDVKLKGCEFMRLLAYMPKTMVSRIREVSFLYLFK